MIKKLIESAHTALMAKCERKISFGIQDQDERIIVINLIPPQTLSM